MAFPCSTKEVVVILEISPIRCQEGPGDGGEAEKQPLHHAGLLRSDAAAEEHRLHGGAAGSDARRQSAEGR